MTSAEEEMQALLPEGWSYETGYGYDGNLICPCGEMIEQDGECGEGHVSPLREQGLI